MRNPITRIRAARLRNSRDADFVDEQNRDALKISRSGIEKPEMDWAMEQLQALFKSAQTHTTIGLERTGGVKIHVEELGSRSAAVGERITINTTDMDVRVHTSQGELYRLFPAPSASESGAGGAQVPEHIRAAGFDSYKLVGGNGAVQKREKIELGFNGRKIDIRTNGTVCGIPSEKALEYGVEYPGMRANGVEIKVLPAELLAVSYASEVMTGLEAERSMTFKTVRGAINAVTLMYRYGLSYRDYMHSNVSFFKENAEQFRSAGIEGIGRIARSIKVSAFVAATEAVHAGAYELRVSQPVLRAMAMDATLPSVIRDRAKIRFGDIELRQKLMSGA
jgi:hypothetical protein